MLVGLTALILAGCNRERANQETGAARDTLAAPSASTPSYGTDTSLRNSDSARMGARHSAADSAKGNQTKSGVTDTRTGKSTLGPGVTKTHPDQGQPVTAKGDTLRRGEDTSHHGGDTSAPMR